MEKQGVVSIRADFSVRVHWYRYSAQWQPDPRARSESFRCEQGPGWNDADEAVAWGRRRAPIVFVRLGAGWRDWYNAGERDGNVDPVPRRWPGAPRRRAANREQDYGGIVYIGEEFPDFLPTGTFDAVWRDADELVLGHEEGFTDVDAAIDWGRARAPVVLVAESPRGWSGFPTYDIVSAGEEDPPGERLERIRARADEGELTWEMTTRVRAPSLSAADHATRLQEALAGAPGVLAATCSPATQPFADLRSPPRASVEVVVRVSAATRKRAHSTAFSAVARAQNSITGERGFAATTRLTTVED